MCFNFKYKYKHICTCIHIYYHVSSSGYLLPIFCASFVSIVVIKILDKKQAKEKRFTLAHNSRLQSILSEKSQQQDPETASHTVHSEAERNECICTLLFFLGPPA